MKLAVPLILSPVGNEKGVEDGDAPSVAPPEHHPVLRRVVDDSRLAVRIRRVALVVAVGPGVEASLGKRVADDGLL